NARGGRLEGRGTLHEDRAARHQGRAQHPRQQRGHMKTVKSTITCDLEGRIETFNAGAEAIFGYPAEEVVGRARVSLFSPGLVVLGHVGNWLATAVAEGR